MRDTTLPNGVRVVTEAIPGVRSAGVGIWIKQGSAHEDRARMGASHLLEHMVFKGTERRSPKQIVLELESLGGSIDAYTSREHTSFQARVLGDHLPIALDVLSDLVRAPLIRDEDLDLEREVVLEEISAVEDTPDDLVFELHGEHLWDRHPYGQSILGTPRTVSALDSQTLKRLHASRYTGRNMVIAAAGYVDHDRVVEQVAELLGDIPEGDPVAPLADPPPPHAGLERVERDCAQSHIVFGCVTPGHTDPLRYPLVLISAAFGGGMSSRLFQRIREELALGYSVYSYQSFHAMAGVSGVYLGTRPGWEDQAIQAIAAEYGRLATEGLPSDELAQIKRQVMGQVMISLESTSARLYRLAGFALYDQPYRTLDEVLTKIDAVSEADIASAAERYFAPESQTVLTLGPAS